MKRDRLAKTVGKRSAIVMTAVMEYICSEVLELAGNITQEANKKRIVPRHIMLAIANDEELTKIINKPIFHESGVAPNIEAKLLQKKKGSKKDAKDE